MNEPSTNALPDPLLTPEAHAEQLKRILFGLLSGWRFAAWSSLDADERYYDLVEEKTNAVKQALEAGGTPYQVMVLVLAPFFLGPDEERVQVLEQSKRVSCLRAPFTAPLLVLGARS